MSYKYKLLEWFIILTTTIIISYVLSIGEARAENKVPLARTLDSEIIRLVKQYGISEKNEKVIRKIIACESQNNPLAVGLNKNKSGEVWSKDYSFFQINDYYHKENMDLIGLDITNPWDNLEYGFILFNDYGIKPWSASSRCWSK